MAKKPATRRNKRPVEPSGKALYGGLKPQLEQVKELLFGLLSIAQTLRPLYRGKVPAVGLVLHLQRIKGELKRELSDDIKNLEIQLARLEERVEALRDELDLAERISRLEEKYDLLIEDQLGSDSTPDPIEEDDGCGDLPQRKAR